MKYPILSGINSPSDLKKLNKSDVPALSSEIREFLIENVERCGGHLASNLGAVEMTLAIHTVFDSPTDHIIFDVGHQSYVHKLLTGRREGFEKLRMPGGLSGFTLTRESEHDPFGAGHSSTSISASLGLAEADALSGRSAHTVCVTGDGAFTGGMIHEALNNCSPDLPLVIIINENGMSISSNKGSFASYLSRVRVSGSYRKLKSETQNAIDRIPLIHRPVRSILAFGKNALKRIFYKHNYFEELGLYYIGPIDGHDYDKLCRAMSDAKAMGKTCVIHIKTTKGKGYLPAEESPDNYHNVVNKPDRGTFHSAFADELIDLAEGDEKILAVTAAMGIGTGLDIFGKKYPDRYFDVGIAEAHALTFSAGLAAGGYKPFVAIYSTFLQRGYDNLLHDIALQGLPVRIMIDRAGLAISDGATHHGIFDVSFISHIPDMILLAPASYASLRSMMRFARETDKPCAIRYSNSAEQSELLSAFKSVSDDNICKLSADFTPSNAPEYIFITYGSILERVVRAAEILRAEGKTVGVVLVETLKPYDKISEVLMQLISSAKRVVYVEEGIRNGGAAEITRSELLSLGLDLAKTDYRIAAIEDNFASPERPCDLYDYVGLSHEKIAEKMRN
nr:1-deoxy-D-xylulose-5-phosphate synthase [Oscillospiraceae bacterium]